MNDDHAIGGIHFPARAGVERDPSEERTTQNLPHRRQCQQTLSRLILKHYLESCVEAYERQPWREATEHSSQLNLPNTRMWK